MAETLKNINATINGTEYQFDNPQIAAEYSASSTYAVGDYCTYQGQTYKCVTAITTAQVWTAANWSTVYVADDIASFSSKMQIQETEIEALKSDAAFSPLFESLFNGDLYDVVEIDASRTGQASANSYTTGGITYSSYLYRLGYRNQSTGVFAGSTHYAVNHAFPLNTAIRTDEPDYITVEYEDDAAMPEEFTCRVQYITGSGTTTVLPAQNHGNRYIFTNTAKLSYPLYVSLGRWASNSLTQAVANARIAYCDSKVHVRLHYKKDTRNNLGRVSSGSDFVYDATLDYAISGVPGTEKTPMVILCHGLSSTISASAWGSSTDMIALVKAFNAAGYFVLDVGRVTAYDWCNPALIKKYIAAVNDAMAKYNVYPAYVYGESMGSLIALWLARYYHTKACAIGGPRLDFEARYDAYTAAGDTTATGVIDANLGFTDGFDALTAAPWAQTIPTALNADGNAVNTRSFPPTLYLFGASDTDYYGQATDKARVAEMQHGGNVVQINDYAGANHHQVCYLLAGTSLADTLAWFETWP